MGHPAGQNCRMFLFVAESRHFAGNNFSNDSRWLKIFFDPLRFKPDLTKSRLNDALYLCETLTGTWTRHQ
jgi:hypothetical protein